MFIVTVRAKKQLDVLRKNITKCGRQLNPHISESYRPTVLRQFVEQSLKRMNLEILDLIQLHCPPAEVYYRPEIFELFDTLKQEGKIRNLGVSVEKVEEALKAIEYSNVTTIQIIFNMLPLASGLLSGTFSKATIFSKGDHRNFNRQGAAFDKGETFSGIDYETGLQAVEQLKVIFPHYQNLAPIALRWILMHKEVSCIIPGASNPEQVISNLMAIDSPDLTKSQIDSVNAIYENKIKPLVHQLW
jgi:aryl-alcohol dehydrogenase-like predicted oxidoreductase